MYGIIGSFIIANYKYITEDTILLTQILNIASIFGSIIMLFYPLLRYKKLSISIGLDLILSLILMMGLIYGIITKDYNVPILIYLYAKGLMHLIGDKTNALIKRVSGRIYKHHFGLVSELMTNAFINSATRWGLLGMVISIIITFLKPEFDKILIIFLIGELINMSIDIRKYKIIKDIEERL
jgi:hypothetical protein